VRFGGYELIEKIGIGGMAEVYRARAVSQEGVERTLVIKKILPEHAANQAFIRMLVAEARVSSLLHHGNIVQVFELGEIDGQYYIAMEYVPGPDLLTVLTAATDAHLRVPLDLALFIISEVCNGLDYAHKATDPQGRPLNLVHRDISPSNVLVSDQGAVKLMDFGVASADLGRRGRKRAIEQPAGPLKGKLGYMAPEQVSTRTVDHRADLFALGIVLFETLTLKRLFLGTSDLQTLANVRDAQIEPKLARHPYIPEEVQAILRRALAKDPVKRYPDAAAFREAILDYLFTQRLRVTNRKLARFLGDLDWHDTTRQTRLRDDAPNPPKTPSPPPVPATGPDTPPTTLSTKAELQAATFHLRQVSGQPLGPIDYETLLGLIHRRAITPNEPLRVDSSPWTTLEKLAAHLDLPEKRLRPDTTPPSQQGPLNRLVLPTLLHQLVTTGANATLRVTDGPRTKSLTLVRGELVGTRSNDPAERLGHFMLTRGLLDAAALAAAIIASAQHETRLGDALVADGTLTPHALVEALQDQLRARALELFGWRQGWYSVHPGDPSTDQMTLAGIDGLELLTQGLRTHWDLPALERLFADQMDRVITPSADAPQEHRLPLTPSESRLQAHLAPGRSVHEAVDTLDPDDRLAVLRLLLLQQRTGHLTLGAAP